MSLDHVAAIVVKALPRAATPLNAMEDFRACGIFPLDRDIFAEEEFVDTSCNITAQEQCAAQQRNSAIEDTFKDQSALEEPNGEETVSNDPLSSEMSLWIDEHEVKYQSTGLESDITAHITENVSNVTEKQREFAAEIMSTLVEKGNSSVISRLAPVVTQEIEGSTVKREPETTRNRRTRKSVDLSDFDVSVSCKRTSGRGGARGRGTGRGRGRPRKVVPEEQPNEDGKRKRGRPRGSGKRGGASSLTVKEEVEHSEEMILGD